MESLIKVLHSTMENYPFEEKVLVVDKYSIGEQIIEAFVKKGFNAINLKYKTVIDLAVEILEKRFPNVPQIIDATVGSQLCYIVLTHLKEKGMLHYFDQMEITASFSSSIFQTIQTLRMAGYTRNSLSPSMFITEKKGQDFLQILSNYEEILQKHQLTDQAELLQLAFQYGEENSKTIYMLQLNLSLTYLEEQFLQTILPETHIKLPLQQVNGIKIPERTGIRSILWGEPSPFSYLYDLENAKESANLPLFTAKTEELEIKNVFQKIKSSQSKLDENVIYYTSGEKYITLLYQLSQKWDIPITFEEGIPISFSRPGRLAAGILQWVKSNYSVPDFIDLLHQGLLNLEDGAPSYTRITGILRDSQIGWGKERYVTQLNGSIQTLKKASIAEDEEKKAYYEDRANQITWLMDWFKTLLRKLPNSEEQMNYKEILTGIAFMIKNYCKTSSALDEMAKQALLDEMEKVIPYSDEIYQRYHIFDKLEDLLLSLSIFRSSPKPGHLHVASYQSGIYQFRENLFIVGLDNRKFPGISCEDPLLLDVERKNLGNNLPLMLDQSQEKLYAMLQVFAQSKGNVTVSYCNFDVNENKVVSPANLFLQCYRLQTGKMDADFNDIQQLPSLLFAAEAFDEWDYWSQYLMQNQSLRFNTDMLDQFPYLSNGLKAEQQRLQSQFTEYDGHISIDQDYDPRKNKENVMTASKLESLAKCPFSYFLGNILRVRPIEDMEFNPNNWLDAATRGSLLHEIFETFYRELQKENEMQSEKHTELMNRIAMECINRQKEILPPPNDRVFQIEVNDILACCKIFLKEEEAHCQTYKPMYFEYSFGENKPAEITLLSGEIVHLAGKIDRIDETESGKYHIIDYKTGSTYNYGRNHIFKGGRQLQHLLYSLAIEQHLQLEAGTVEESAYYFPTVKGLGERFIRNQDVVVRTNGLDILERLINVLANGSFTMTDDKNDCKFCQYNLVCRRQFYDEEILEQKQMDKNYEALRGFKGVRVYD
jgi:RecB family exonuclease